MARLETTLDTPAEPPAATPGADGELLSARCSCGAVHFSLEDAFIYAFYCHCSRCRRRTGAACAAIGGIPSEKVRITRGDELVLKLDASDRGFVGVCQRCCSPVFSTVNGGRTTHIPLGVLDRAPSKRPDHHIQVASKAAWHQIGDDLPQFAEFPP